MPSPDPISTPFSIPPGQHAIVNATFMGALVKTMEVKAIIEGEPDQLMSFGCNCDGDMCRTTVLIGDPNNALEFKFELNGYNYLCGGPIGNDTNIFAPSGAPIGGGVAGGVSVTSYMYSTSIIGSSDTACITIILQVGLDPSTFPTGRC